MEKNSSVAVLLWPPHAVCDPSLPRVDLLAYMLDPKKHVEQEYQMCEITTDRIFLDRYHDLERETQDQVRRELQDCFAEQGCARSISVKEWAKQTNERQTPRLRLRCTKVCGFGFQVNFDMERNQYYLVRSRGKSGNFLHKCPEPPNTSTPVTPLVAPAQPPAAAVPIPPMAPPEVQGMGYVASSPVPSIVQPMENQPPIHGSQLEALDGFHLMIPQPNAGAPPQPSETAGYAPVPTPVLPRPAVAAPPATAPTPVPGFAATSAAEPFAAAAAAVPETPTQPGYFGSSNLVRETAAETAQEFHDMDVCSVDSTDWMIARHFGTDHNSGSSSGKMSERMTSSTMGLPTIPSSGMIATSGSHATRTQVNNEAEFPTVNSLRSFWSMMSGSINSTLGKSWFARNNSIGTAGHAGDNMLTTSSQAHMNQVLANMQAQDKRGGGDDPMDTVNSALSALSVSGLNTIGAAKSEDASASNGEQANPFTPDFWSPPPPS